MIYRNKSDEEVILTTLNLYLNVLRSRRDGYMDACKSCNGPPHENVVEDQSRDIERLESVIKCLEFS